MQGGGHDGADRHAFDRAGIQAIFPQHGGEKYAEFIRGIRGLGGFAKLAEQRFAVEHTAVNLAVTDVETEEHGSQG
jgi:hypothetical protein